jgi:hypothetical protein
MIMIQRWIWNLGMLQPSPLQKSRLKIYEHRGGYKRERLQRITAEGENPDNSNEGIPRSLMWLLIRNDSSTEPCISESSFSS